MGHTTPISQPVWLVLAVYAVLSTGAPVVTVALLWGRDRRMLTVRKVAATAVVAGTVGVGTLVATGLLLGTKSAPSGLMLVVPVVVFLVAGAGLLRWRRSAAPLDATLYAGVGTFLGLLVWVGLLLAATVLLVGTGRDLVGVLAVALTIALPVVPLAVVSVVGDRLAAAYEPLPDGWRVAAVGIALGLAALPVAGVLYPQVPVGVTPPSPPERPATLTNETVTDYVAAYEFTRWHRRTAGKGGCDAMVVDRQTAARSLAEAEDTSADRVDLPAGDGYFVVADCGGATYSGPPYGGHGDAWWYAIYYVDDSTTDRLGEGSGHYMRPPETSG